MNSTDVLAHQKDILKFGNLPPFPTFYILLNSVLMGSHENLSWTPWTLPLLCPIIVYILPPLRKPLLWPLHLFSWFCFQIVNPLKFVTYIADESMDRFYFFLLESANLTHASAVSGELSRGLCWSCLDYQMFGAQWARASSEGPWLVQVWSPLCAVSSSKLILMAMSGFQESRNIQSLGLRTGQP